MVCAAGDGTSRVTAGPPPPHAIRWSDGPFPRGAGGAHDVELVVLAARRVVARGARERRHAADGDAAERREHDGLEDDEEEARDDGRPALAPEPLDEGALGDVDRLLFGGGRHFGSAVFLRARLECSGLVDASR